MPTEAGIETFRMRLTLGEPHSANIRSPHPPASAGTFSHWEKENPAPKRKEAAVRRPQVKGGNAQRRAFAPRHAGREGDMAAFADDCKCKQRRFAHFGNSNVAGGLIDRSRHLLRYPKRKEAAGKCTAAPSLGRKRPRRASNTEVLHRHMYNAALHKKQELFLGSCRTAQTGPCRFMYVWPPIYGSSHEAGRFCPFR